MWWYKNDLYVLANGRTRWGLLGMMMNREGLYMYHVVKIGLLGNNNKAACMENTKDYIRVFKKCSSKSPCQYLLQSMAILLCTPTQFCPAPSHNLTPLSDWPDHFPFTRLHHLPLSARAKITACPRAPFTKRASSMSLIPARIPTLLLPLYPLPHLYSVWRRVHKHPSPCSSSSFLLLFTYNPFLSTSHPHQNDSSFYFPTHPPSPIFLYHSLPAAVYWPLYTQSTLPPYCWRRRSCRQEKFSEPLLSRQGL